MAGLLVLLTILAPWGGAAWVMLARSDQLRQFAAVLSSVIAACAALLLLAFTLTTPSVEFALGGVFGTFTFVPDGLGAFLAAVATTIGCLTVIFSLDYMRGEHQLGRYYALVLLFIGAMCGLVLSGSLLLLFIFWEMTALCSYALISFHNDDPKAVAGGIKALVITQIGGVGLLVGILAAYAQLGTLDISVLIANAGSLPADALTITAFGFLIAAAAKSAQVPFHTWLPGAMEAPTPVSALIHAATMVNAGVYLLARFYPAFAAVPGWTTAVLIIGLLSALFGALMALSTHDLKRALAYSTISQLGFMVYAIGAGGIFASQFHLLNHAVFKALLFLGAGAVIHTMGTRDMRRMGGLSRAMPFVRNVFVIGGLALAGVPFFNGFWSKELILEAGLETAVWSFVIMLFTAGLTALYTLRMIWLVFFGEAHAAFPAHDAPNAMRIALGVLAAGVLGIWLLSGAFGHLLETTLPYHEGVLHVESTADMIFALITAPATWLTLAVIGLGFALWVLRARLTALTNALTPIMRAAAADFGFEWLNRRIVTTAQSAAVLLRRTQTGQLNWNVVGIVTGLVMVLVVLMVGR